MKYLSRFLLTIFVIYSNPTQTMCQQAIPEAIKANIRARVDNGENQNIIIGVLDEKGKHYYSYGHISDKNKIAPKKYTLYEIGSVSKTFTGLALAKAVVDGNLSLSDPLKDHIPGTVTFTPFDDQDIQLLHLANHHSGLPRMPDNMPYSDPENPFSDYTAAHMWEFLGDHTLRRAPNSQYEYSNYAMGMLGHILAEKKGMDYDGLIESEICAPMKMVDTKEKLNADQLLRVSPGHRGSRQVINWDFAALAGAGAIRSSASELLTYLMYQMEFKTAPGLTEAIRLSHKATASTGKDSEDSVALGWHIKHGEDTRLIWHNGQTAGYHSFLGFDKENKRGIVVLSNNSQSIDDIGLHFLNPEVPLKEIKETVKLGVETLDQYVGVYSIRPGVEVKVRRENLQLTIQLTGQGAFEIYPESETRFFLKLVDAQLEFNQNEKGETESMTMFQNGGETVAKRTSTTVPEEEEKKTIEVSKEDLTKFVGTYQLMPGVEFTVTQKEAQLYIKVTGQNNFQVYPESPDTFFYKVVEAKIKFEVLEDGTVPSLTLFQGGMEQKATRNQ